MLIHHEGHILHFKYNGAGFFKKRAGLSQARPVIRNVRIKNTKNYFCHNKSRFFKKLESLEVLIHELATFYGCVHRACLVIKKCPNKKT